MRELVPDVAGVAREAMGMALDSLAAVAATLGGSAAGRNDAVRQINPLHRDAVVQFEGAMHRGSWRRDGFSDAIGAQVEAATTALAGAISGDVVSTLISSHGWPGSRPGRARWRLRLKSR